MIAMAARLRWPGCSATGIACDRRIRAPVVKLVDALDSKSSSFGSAGSIPARGTTYMSDSVRHYLDKPHICHKCDSLCSMLSSTMCLQSVKTGAMAPMSSTGVMTGMRSRRARLISSAMLAGSVCWFSRVAANYGARNTG